MKGISIIVPIYNTKVEYLKECMRSLLKQKHKEYEIILVNDCSTKSETISYCEKISSENNLIKLINLEENKGVSNARNIGIKNSKYDWIMFVDADDWISDECLEKLGEKICNCDEDVIIFNSNIVYKNFVEKNKFLKNSNNEIIYSFDDIIMQIINKTSAEYYPRYNCVGVTWGKIYRKDFVVSNNVFFNENLSRAEDHIFFLNLLEKNPKIKYVDEYYYFYRKNLESVVNRFNEKLQDNFQLTLNELERYIERNFKDNEKYNNAFHKRCLFYFFVILSNNIFHVENNLPINERKKIVYKIMNSEPYLSAFKNKKISISPKQNLIYILIKLGMFRLVKKLYAYMYNKNLKNFK